MDDKVIELQEFVIKKKSERRLFVNAYIERWVFEEKSLSWADKGLLAYMLATQNEGSVNQELWDMAPPEYRQQYKDAVKELISVGYVDMV